MRILVLITFYIGISYSLSAQTKNKEYTYQTFKSHALINQKTVETLQKNKLDIRIGHRFGDFAGDAGGWPTFYGLENAADVLIGGFYGVTDNITVGLTRTKGSNPAFRQNLNGSIKYKWKAQTTDFKTPFTITFHHVTSVTTQESSGNEFSQNNYDKFSDRVSYVTQVIIGSKLNDRISLQVTPSWSHRNQVLSGDNNDIFAAGIGGKFQLTKHLGLIGEATFPISDFHTTDNGFYPSIGGGLEIETSGHVFQINFTNSEDITETGFIPFTNSNWLDGQFRLGFTISRQFNL